MVLCRLTLGFAAVCLLFFYLCYCLSCSSLVFVFFVPASFFFPFLYILHHSSHLNFVSLVFLACKLDFVFFFFCLDSPSFLLSSGFDFWRSLFILTLSLDGSVVLFSFVGLWVLDMHSSS